MEMVWNGNDMGMVGNGMDGKEWNENEYNGNGGDYWHVFLTRTYAIDAFNAMGFQIN